MLQGALMTRLWKDLLPRVPPRAVAGLGKLLFSRSWRAFEGATEYPAAHQRARLAAILARNRDTEFGRAHGFNAIRSPDDYRAAVPVRAWSEFEPYVTRMVHGEHNILTAEEIVFYGRSSGTTGTPKYVPVTPS